MWPDSISKPFPLPTEARQLAGARSQWRGMYIQLRKVLRTKHTDVSPQWPGAQGEVDARAGGHCAESEPGVPGGRGRAGRSHWEPRKEAAEGTLRGGWATERRCRVCPVSRGFQRPVSPPQRAVATGKPAVTHCSLTLQHLRVSTHCCLQPLTSGH